MEEEALLWLWWKKTRHEIYTGACCDQQAIWRQSFGQSRVPLKRGGCLKNGAVGMWDGWLCGRRRQTNAEMQALGWEKTNKS